MTNLARDGTCAHIIVGEDGRIFIQATGQPKVEMFAESETQFFLKVVKAKITFNKNAQGNVTGFVLNQGGAELPSKKISP